MRKVDEVNTEARRKVVLLAAMRCFARIGLQRTSINDICKEAGMRSGLLYYYFPSKEAIVEAVYEIGSEDLVSRIEHMLDEDDIVSAIIKIHEEEETNRREWHMTPGLRLEFSAESTRNERLSVTGRTRIARLMAAMRKAADRAIATGRLDPRFDPETFAHAIALIWSGLGLLRVDTDFDLAPYQRVIATLLEPWLLTPAAEPAPRRKNARGRA